MFAGVIMIKMVTRTGLSGVIRPAIKISPTLRTSSWFPIQLVKMGTPYATQTEMNEVAGTTVLNQDSGTGKWLKILMIRILNSLYLDLEAGNLV